jgi:hypothetical protein
MEMMDLVSGHIEIGRGAIPSLDEDLDGGINLLGGHQHIEVTHPAFHRICVGGEPQRRAFEQDRPQVAPRQHSENPVEFKLPE